VGKDAALHVLRPSRGEDVIVEIMGESRVPAWVSDCWAPQLRAPAEKRQLCLGHQIRNLQGLIDRAPRLRWAREMQGLFLEAIHLVKRRDEMSDPGFKRQSHGPFGRRYASGWRSDTKSPICPCHS
jgi:transposase